MAGILIIAHAPLATALRDCIAHIYGGVPARIGCIDVLADSDPTQVMAFAHAELARLLLHTYYLHRLLRPWWPGVGFCYLAPP